MSKSTRATQALAKAGISFAMRQYAYETGAEKIGLQAAAAIGEAPSRVLKTLMVEVDGKPACTVIPSDGALSMVRYDNRTHSEAFDQLWDPIFSPDSTKLLIRAVQQGSFIRLVLPVVE